MQVAQPLEEQFDAELLVDLFNSSLVPLVETRHVKFGQIEAAISEVVFYMLCSARAAFTEDAPQKQLKLQPI